MQITSFIINSKGDTMIDRRTLPRFAPLARVSLASTINAAMATWRQRRHLEKLDDNALKDIGISRHQAETEANRPLWDVPNHWLR